MPAVSGIRNVVPKQFLAAMAAQLESDIASTLLARTMLAPGVVWPGERGACEILWKVAPSHVACWLRHVPRRSFACCVLPSVCRVLHADAEKFWVMTAGVPNISPDCEAENGESAVSSAV